MALGGSRVARRGGTGTAAATYIVLAGLQRGVSLLILPLITHAMRPSEYGAASVLASASILLTAVIAMPLTQLIIRTATSGVRNDPALLRTAGTYCYFVVPLASALLALCVSLFVPEVFGVAGFLWGIELLAIGLQPASSIYALWVAQARNDLPRFVRLSSASIVITAVAKIVFVVLLELGVLGWVISDLVSATVSAILAMFLVRLPKAKVNTSHIRQVLAFTLPLIPHSASLWALNFLSRPAMVAVSSLEQVGLFSFGLSLTSAASLVLVETNRATLAHYARELFPAPTSETFGVVRWQLVAAFAIPATIGCGLAIAGPWMIDKAYWPSFALTGLLLVGQAAYGLYIVPMNYLTQTAGLPRFSSLASGAGAVTIVALIFTLGRRQGAEGAVHATVIGYFVMAGTAMLLTIFLRLEIHWSSWFKNWPEVLFAASALACSLGALSSPVGSREALALAGGGLIMVLSGLLATRLRRAL